ncbi:hypothetical protein BUALT_Bualt12G0093000 [Buddleja alternifolia]|uniref:Trichome birefringence-like N-terminal domain-containing protein n=1 Tax=Buddleja alternifolia TaxID=168488 RepID=A0AAV6WYD2_9LAMI|nr:hypothetical protein BUALT_Bualt12G0093000 [Buddleja alternifolia]
MKMGSSNNNPFKDQTNYSFTNKLFPYTLYALLPIAIIHLYLNPFSFSFSPTDLFPYTNRITISPSKEVLRKSIGLETSCDYSNGTWVQDNLGPLYNGTTCDTIKNGQNCMVYGRPDKDYLNWRWKPKNCKLPRFNPNSFLKLVKNKHIAFVGDSLARNQLESLLCMMGTISKPQLLYTDGEANKNRKWHIPSHNINVSIYWSPFLVKGIEKNTEKDFNTLYLDSVDEKWAKDLEFIDFLVLSVGHWYLHPAVYHNGNNVVLGCHYCQNYTEIGFYDVFGKALETTFRKIVERKGQNGNESSVFLTTFSPAHFEGEWDKFGACSKTQPYKEKVLEGMDAEMRKVGVEEVRKAKLRVEEFGNSNLRLEALDISGLALLRADGHPGPYMNPFPFANGVGERVQNDCVHWCLPGPIDTWNEILLDVLKRWGGEYKGKLT